MDREELRALIAFAAIEGSAGPRAAKHDYKFETANWTNALRSADAILTALDEAGVQMIQRHASGDAELDAGTPNHFDQTKRGFQP